MKKKKINEIALAIMGIRLSLIAIGISLSATVVSMSDGVALWAINLSKFILIIGALVLFFMAFKIKGLPLHK